MSDSSASSAIEIKFEDTLDCCVCLDEVKDARILPCGHTQCKPCIIGCVEASDFAGLFECPECKSAYPIADVESLPRCAEVNELLEKIERKELTVDRKSPEMRAIFRCHSCNELMTDARSLTCGHSSCQKCLAARVSSKANQVSCPRRGCGNVCRLPAGGVDELPVNYRINGIVDDLKGDRTKTRPRSSDQGQSSGASPLAGHGRQRNHPRSSNGHQPHKFEDVGEAKKRAKMDSAKTMNGNSSYTGKCATAMSDHNDDIDQQKRNIQLLTKLPTGKMVTITADANGTVGELKTRIKSAVHYDESQQSLSFNGRNLDDSRQTLPQCGISNHDTIHLNGRLRGGHTTTRSKLQMRL